jgi:hypothetical protein
VRGLRETVPQLFHAGLVGSGCSQRINLNAHTESTAARPRFISGQSSAIPDRWAPSLGRIKLPVVHEHDRAAAAGEKGRLVPRPVFPTHADAEVALAATETAALLPRNVVDQGHRANRRNAAAQMSIQLVERSDAGWQPTRYASGG